MATAGLSRLATGALGLIATGLPAFSELIGATVLFAALGIAGGAFDHHLLTALPARIVGLLESDILQALPLYVLIGALLDRMPLADILFRAAAQALRRTPAAPRLAAL